MLRGTLNRARRPARKAIRSAVSSGPGSVPGAGCTTALISSPHSSCGMPNTATSSTAGWAGSARLLRVLVVVEGRGAHAHVHQPGLARGDVVSLVVEHMHLRTRPGQADRTRPVQPLRPGDDG